MPLRLWHIVALMSLILLAGVLSIQQLESHVGRTTVPGLVLVDAPDVNHATAEAILRRLPGAELGWVPANEAPCAPFDPQTVRTLRSRGHAAALVQAWPAPAAGAPVGAAGASGAPGRRPNGDSGADEGLHDAWGVLVHDENPDRASARLADFVRECNGVRPFVLGLQLRAPSVTDLVSAVTRQVDAAETLPSFRRTTVVMLGAREPQTGRRLVVRIDRGDLDRPSLDALKDLLALAQ